MTLKIVGEKVFRREYKTFVQAYYEEKMMITHNDELLQVYSQNAYKDTTWLPKVRLMQKKIKKKSIVTYIKIGRFN